MDIFKAFWQKASALLFTLMLLSFIGQAQEELHIHQINVEDGDATLVGIYNTQTHRYSKTILIDGGNANPNDYLLPYLRKVTGTDKPHFDYAVLTHYHRDHFNGLSALRDGRMLADSVIDPSGYPISEIFPQQKLKAPEVTPAHLIPAKPWLASLKTAADKGFVKGHVTSFLSYGTGKHSAIGKKMLLGTADGIPVELECVAGWGNSLSDKGIIPNPSPNKDNQNNYTLAFVLTCGEFRYFIGGDLGGSSKGDYIDQETPLIYAFAKLFPVSWSYNHSVSVAGHICGFKAGHHGSEYSNSANFMKSMTPAVNMVSAGHQTSWHLPNPVYFERLESVAPLSAWTSTSNFLNNQGVYITNLYDFKAHKSKTIALKKFGNRQLISFNYGNDTNTNKASYLINVDASNLAERSVFEVYRIDLLGKNKTLLSRFACHIKN